MSDGIPEMADETRTYKFNCSGESVGVSGDDNTVTLFIPGKFTMIIDCESAAVLAKAIYARAVHMSLEQAEQFVGAPLVDPAQRH